MCQLQQGADAFRQHSSSPTSKQQAKRRTFVVLNVPPSKRACFHPETLRKHARHTTACCGQMPLLSPSFEEHQGLRWPVLQADLHGVPAGNQPLWNVGNVLRSALFRVQLSPPRGPAYRKLCNEHGFSKRRVCAGISGCGGRK